MHALIFSYSYIVYTRLRLRLILCIYNIIHALLSYYLFILLDLLRGVNNKQIYAN